MPPFNVNNMCADHLFYVSRADIFSVYPTILQEILVLEELFRAKKVTAFRTTISTEKVQLQLPSEFDWQLKQYFRLLEQQKKINAAEDSGIQLKTSIDLKETTLWESTVKSIEELSPFSSPSPGDSSSTLRRKRRRCYLDNPIDFCNIDEYNQWRLEDIARAGKLLKNPPQEVSFDDEFVMRKVYSMIYDVFRFKLVLQQALKNINFYEKHPQHETTRVWLLLYDMYLRKFAKREPEMIALKNVLFNEACLLEIEKCLEIHNVKIAAALTRIRIQNSAYSLITLLPPHLQDEKVAAVVSNPIVTGWINTFRIRNKNQASDLLSSIGLLVIEEPVPSVSSLLTSNNPKQIMYIPLSAGRYKWDKLCPQVISIFPENRTEFIRSEIFQRHEMIIQDRSFTIGPTIFTNLLEYYELTGDVVQTHISSPRSTAYLASLLFNSRRVRNFLAFGCGSKLNDYRQYMTALGVNNVKLYAESFIDIPHGAGMIERVVGILANPPSSYSAVSDPIDLICSRGGDLSMLEMLSESEMTNESKQRVAKLLVEQRETLKHCMSRPQVQIVLYQTHSVVETENETMVEKVIEYINQKVYEVHVQAAKERELAALAEAAGNQLVNRLLGRQDTNKTNKTEEFCDNQSEVDGDSQKTSVEDVEVPLSDQFETSEIPDFCSNHDNCLSFAEDGLFLSLIKRKEVIRLDSKYLIKIAEVRGIFGNNNTNPEFRTNVKVTKRQDKKAEEREAIELENRKRRSSNMDSLISRLIAPTQASLKRGHHHRVSSMEHKFMYIDPCQEWCPRFAAVRSEYNLSVLSDEKLSHHSTDMIPRARIWWRDTIKYVRQRNRLVKQQHEMRTLGPLLLKRHFAHCKNGYEMEYPKRFRSSYYNRAPYPLPIRMLEFRQYNSENFLLYERDDNQCKSKAKASRLSRQNAITSGFGRQVRVRSSRSC
ncbi:uncharacterized protein LOC131692450 isoform X2 [Topomyia yanbarensis]|uniref:uncharacterized protein LOC131692450 isoform X2 n=1 Tax=Topomyia yanbarensis TaxID=2498891 RepID=UPI00273B63AA|nr:uncharacterized protein LOC131692450 isoform X2 [Topomyia yanbarensis]